MVFFVILAPLGSALRENVRNFLGFFCDLKLSTSKLIFLQACKVILEGEKLIDRLFS